MLLGGCAQSPEAAGSAGTAPSAVPSSAVPSSGAPSSAVASPLPERTPTKKPVTGSSTTLTGTVLAGVEPGCLLLEDGSATHLLIFADESLGGAAPVGSKVQVTGVPQPGMMTTCQQGEPFLVSSVTPR
ncbi:hypothetical protein GCM10023107_46670 [Actinoplanes octamycinicus]|nr:hypothetical protein Aoc01nite_00270 [Actinoplanes octamycinicus]